MIAVLSAVLLQQHAVQAAGQETVILTAQQGKAAVEIELPDNSGGVSTLRLRVRIEGDTGYLDPVEPMKFEADAEIDPTLLQTRYQKDTGYFTIYISDTGKITDRSRFCTGISGAEHDRQQNGQPHHIGSGRRTGVRGRDRAAEG